ncbi:MAG: alpha-L-rhamnosidase C-terminal domain-containing protein, partial [Planctomycetota bacterium]
IAGIASVAPGFRRIRVRPGVVGDLTSARASIKSVCGTISVDWEKRDGSFTMKATVPVNATAEIHLPKLGMNDVTISESGTVLWQSGTVAESIPGIVDVSESDEAVVLNVGSGSYVFELTGQA